MAFLFRNKQKSNGELSRSTKDMMLKLSAEEKLPPKVDLPTPSAASVVYTADQPTGRWKKNWLGTCRR